MCFSLFCSVFLSTIHFESIPASPLISLHVSPLHNFFSFAVIFFFCFVFGIWPALVFFSRIEHFTTLLQLALQFNLSSMASHHVPCWLTNFPYDVKVFLIISLQIAFFTTFSLLLDSTRQLSGFKIVKPFHHCIITLGWMDYLSGFTYLVSCKLSFSAYSTHKYIC